MGSWPLLLLWPSASLAGRPQVVEWSGNTPAEPVPSSTLAITSPPSAFVPCQGNKTHACSPSLCLPLSRVCDGTADCPDSSDEAGCQARCEGPHWFSCDNGHCIAVDWTCDKENDCMDWSDENYFLCKQNTTSAPVSPPVSPTVSPTVSPAVSLAGRGPGQADLTGPSAEGPDSPVDFTIHSFDCPDCIDGHWMTIMNVKGTPTNNSMMEFSCSGLKVRQAAFYLLLPVLPKDDPERRTPPHVQIFTPGSDQARAHPLDGSTVSTVWLNRGDVIIFKTTTRDMKFVPGTMIKVHAV